MKTGNYLKSEQKANVAMQQSKANKPHLEIGLTTYDEDKMVYCTDVGEMNNETKGDLICTVYGFTKEESQENANILIEILNKANNYILNKKK